MSRPKRRNLARWQASRLRRLDHKIASGKQWTRAGWVTVPAADLDRCRERANALSATLSPSGHA